MHSTIDVVWNSNSDNLMKLFPNGNPTTLEEFLIAIKDEILKYVTH